MHLLKFVPKSLNGLFYTLVSLPYAFIAIAALATSNSTADEYDDYEKKVDKLEIKMEVKRTAFLKFLEQGISKMKTAKNLTSLEKRDLIEQAKNEISEFRENNELPDHPGLISYSYDFAKTTQIIIQEAEELRRKIVAESLLENGLIQQNYKNLELRIDNIVAGSEPWKVGVEWKGTRTDANGSSFRIILMIDKMIGNSIEGRLSQTNANGNRDVMTVSGSRVGNLVHMETTGMKVGAARKLVFDGYIVGKNLVANMSGNTKSGDPANGMISLHP